MKRWVPWLVIPLVMSMWVFMTRASSAALLKDSDTAVLLANIHERGNPWSWFGGDWPLFNHFYRPVSTLFFEFDLGRAGMNSAAFGATNALIAGICIWLCFWVARELTDRPITAGFATLIFGLAHVQLGWVSSVFGAAWIVAMVSLIGLSRKPVKSRWVPVGLAFFGCLFLAGLVPGPLDFRGRIVDWLPGRTASVMAIFALISVASYARFERLCAGRISRAPTSSDLPATKGTVVDVPGQFAWVWVLVSAAGLALALGAYEQAVVVPALITGVMIMFSLLGRRVHWMNLLLFWGVLVGYLVLRRSVVPSDVSGYQSQQFRDGVGVWLDLSTYVLPGAGGVMPLWTSLDLGLLGLLNSGPWVALGLILGNIVAIIGIWKDPQRWLAVALLLMGLVAFLPMAWLKFFAHYHYLPAVFYCLFLVVFGEMVVRWVVESLSPSRIQAPSRAQSNK